MKSSQNVPKCCSGNLHEYYGLRNTSTKSSFRHSRHSTVRVAVWIFLIVIMLSGSCIAHASSSFVIRRHIGPRATRNIKTATSTRARRMMLQKKNLTTTTMTMISRFRNNCGRMGKFKAPYRFLSTTTTTSRRMNRNGDNLLGTTCDDINNVAIVGGGLAGLSAAYHLLEKTIVNKNEEGYDSLRLTVFDTAPVGTGGASSVAGGLLHPFSPRGKLIHHGIEGLDATNHLLSVASKYEPKCILRDQMYRLALTEQHEQQLRETAIKFPQHCDWLDTHDMNLVCHTTESRGGLRFKSGKVIHVPTYLQGLWKACQELSSKSGGDIEWVLLQQDEQEQEPSLPPPQTQEEWKSMLRRFDTVVLSAGAGLLQDQLVTTKNPEKSDWPVQLVRGQSVELKVPTTTAPTPSYEAVLCGKYATPLVDSTKMLIGATHEFQPEAMPVEEVVKDLRERSYSLAPWLWDDGVVDTVTHGWRVQSNRGPKGRTPILGRVPPSTALHDNAWIFTGLSSRGLIHHGLYGDILTDAILTNDEEGMFTKHDHLQWWKKYMDKT
mmetsp:Transcript_16961/g.23572  ORF Transcript_16961/g.23572 Transcript_16961/m.23572 type:complete len:549 (+) Transcript_16961:135-1781(+)